MFKSLGSTVAVITLVYAHGVILKSSAHAVLLYSDVANIFILLRQVLYICGIVLYKPMGTHTIWEARRYDIWMASSHGRHRNLSVIVSDPLQLQCERTAGSHRGRHRERSTSTTVPVLPQKIYAGGGSVHRLPGCPNCVFRVAVPGSGSHLRQLGNTAHFWRARTMCGNPHPWLIPQAALGSRRGAVSFSSSRFV